MRAVQVNSFGGPKVLKVQEVNFPAVSDSQILIKVKSAGVNIVDTTIREGQHPRLPELPYIPGREGAGVIERVGENVTKFHKGQRVFFVGDATYAEYCVTDERNIFLLDERLSFDQGASIGVAYLTAYRAIFINGAAAPGETILIHGASGAVGLAAVQLAKHFKMKVFGTAGTEDGMRLVKKNGADYVFCHKDSHYMKDIMESTGDNGVDVIIEMVAHVNLVKDLDILANRGRVMIVGCTGSVSINPRVMMLRETRIVGVARFNSSKEEFEEASSGIMKGIKEGYITPVVDKCYTLDQVQDAHRDIIKSRGAKGKLVITIAK